MRRAARALFRRLFPRRQHPLLDGTFSLTARDEGRERAYKELTRRLEPLTAEDPFVQNRYFEGRRWRGVMRHYLPQSERVRLLDIGAGNGAIELALSATPPFLAFSLEYEWNQVAAAVHAMTEIPLRRAIADANSLPYGDATFDGVLCLETLEHVRAPERMGAEIARVLRPGGVVLVTTPPRWRYAFAPDPHFGIVGLALLSPALQRRVAARRGFLQPWHHVERLFGSTREIETLFPSCHLEMVLTRSRAPTRWFWDAIVLRKSPP